MINPRTNAKSSNLGRQCVLFIPNIDAQLPFQDFYVLFLMWMEMLWGLDVLEESRPLVKVEGDFKSEDKGWDVTLLGDDCSVEAIASWLIRMHALDGVNIKVCTYPLWIEGSEGSSVEVMMVKGWISLQLGPFVEL